jgi:hypothetical protein
MCRLESVEESIDRIDLKAIPRPILTSSIDKHSIVIPLDVSDFDLTDDSADLGEEIIEGLFVRKVENEFMTPERLSSLMYCEHPLRMSPIEIRIGIDHLSFEPETELHSLGADVICDGSKTLRPDLRRNSPITEATSITSSRAKPAIIEYDALHTDISSVIDDATDAILAMIEVDRLPHVER